MKLRYLLAGVLISAAASNIQAQTIGTWTNTGPIAFPVNVSGQVDGIGRVCQMKFHPTNSQKMYAVSASGGLFISSDNGQSWAPTPGTEQLPTTACSSVCIDFTNDNILYLSTGDPDYYYEDYGIYKSTDGGLTWNPANGNIGTRMAVEMIMDPNNHNTIVAATDDGIWKTTDGGSTWTETVNGGDFKDMKMKPGTTNTLYSVTSSAYYKSTDMGSTWSQITNGLNVPSGNDGMRIAVSAADPSVVYIGTTDANCIVMKSTNSGQSFTTVYNSSTQCLVCYDDNPGSGSQRNYNFSMTANPLNANEVVIVAHCVWRSTDGGVNWSRRTNWYDVVHTDMHDVKFNPYNNNQLFNANDGGVWLSTDTTYSAWNPRSDGLAASEIYHAAQSPAIRQMVNIGTQDNGELYFDGIWKCNRGGDWGSKNRFDYESNGTAFYLTNGNKRALAPLGGEVSYNSPFAPADNSSIEFVPSMHDLCFAGGTDVWRSSDITSGSPTWTQIMTGTEQILDIASCRGDSNILYVVTDQNHLYRSTNALSGTPTFTTITTPGNTNVTASIATDRRNANIVYLACNGRIYRSSNKGLGWSDITNGLPAGGMNISKVIHDDYSANERVFVNIGNYVYYKTLTGAWTNISTGLPTIPNYTDFMIYNDSTAASILRLSTYGRGVWECPIYNNLPAVISFNSDKQYVCPSDTVRFYKTVYGSVNSFTWSFPGGMPSTSTADSPVVVFHNSGVYDVTLKITGQGGTDSLVKSSYISVSNGQGTSLAEGFEGSAFPPAGWQQESQSGTLWQKVDTVGGFAQSTHSMVFDNYNFDAGGKHDRMIAAKLDLTHAISASLSFDVAYAFYDGYHDSLQVEISTDCGKTFVSVYEKDSTRLATAPNTGAFFVPNAAQWRRDTISLTPYLGNSIEIAFDNIGHYGQPVYIDNVNIPVTVGVKAINNASELELYPNPTKGLVNIKGSKLSGKTATIECYNMLGQLVSSKNVSIESGMFNTSMDISHLPPAVYEIVIQSDSGGKYIKQVVLQ